MSFDERAHFRLESARDRCPSARICHRLVTLTDSTASALSNEKAKIRTKYSKLEIKPTADDFVHSAPHASPLTTAVSAGGVHEIVRTRRRPPPRPSQPHSLGAGNTSTQRDLRRAVECARSRCWLSLPKPSHPTLSVRADRIAPAVTRRTPLGAPRPGRDV